jgi:hypothetical protein
VTKRPAVVGAGLSFALTLVLIRLVAIDNIEALIVLAPAALGAILALRSTPRSVLWIAALLTLATASVSLIGGVGLLCLPSIVLFAVGAARGRRPEPDSRGWSSGSSSARLWGCS